MSLQFELPCDMLYAYGETSTDRIATIVLSKLLLISAFISRVVRLHKTLFVGASGRTRTACSAKLKGWQQRVYTVRDVFVSPKSLKRRLLYRPCLAIFLTMRVLADLWTSMFGEVRRSPRLVIR